MDSTAADASGLFALLDGKKPDGSPRFSDAELLHALPLMLMGLARGAPEIQFSPFVEDLLSQTASRAGVTPQAAPDVVVAALERYYAANPVKPELVMALEQHFRAALASGGPSAAAQAFEAFAGVQKSLKPLAQDGQRPKGTVAAGPMAAFLVKGGKKPGL